TFWMDSERRVAVTTISSSPAPCAALLPGSDGWAICAVTGRATATQIAATTAAPIPLEEVIRTPLRMLCCPEPCCSGFQLISASAEIILGSESCQDIGLEHKWGPIGRQCGHLQAKMAWMTVALPKRAGVAARPRFAGFPRPALLFSER